MLGLGKGREDGVRCDPSTRTLLDFINSRFLMGILIVAVTKVV